MKSISVGRKGRGRPRVGATNIGLRLPPAGLAPLDAYVASLSEPRPSRQEAIRNILADWLRTHGFLAADAPKPTGPATDVVEAMEMAIKKHRGSRKP